MYTAAMWFVKEGQEGEFERLWQASADNLALEFPGVTFRLLRNADDRRRFVSVGGPWRGAEQIAAARELPSFKEATAAVGELIESGDMASYDLVAEIS
jgi:heme-degrading monooxygenase HmoA